MLAIEQDPGAREPQPGVSRRSSQLVWEALVFVMLRHWEAERGKTVGRTGARSSWRRRSVQRPAGPRRFRVHSGWTIHSEHLARPQISNWPPLVEECHQFTSRRLMAERRSSFRSRIRGS